MGERGRLSHRGQDRGRGPSMAPSSICGGCSWGLFKLSLLPPVPQLLIRYCTDASTVSRLATQSRLILGSPQRLPKGLSTFSRPRERPAGSGLFLAVLRSAFRSHRNQQSAIMSRTSSGSVPEAVDTMMHHPHVDHGLDNKVNGLANSD